MSPSDSKQSLRKEARARRREAFEIFGARIGPVLANNFFARFTLAPDAIIAGYWPVGEEAELRPLLKALAERGHRVCLPRVASADAPLEFLEWRPGEKLAPGFGGIPVPDEARAVLVPDVVLVPLLAFDRSGARLGYGAGLYDRTLKALRAAGTPLVVGVAYSAQEADALPADGFDEPLGWILTELGSRSFGSGDGLG
jgi:5-formyltetrahydrofolate cyclo-ligase